MVARVGRRSDTTLRAAIAERQAHFGRFDLHAGVAVPAGDLERLEHLARYVLRPPVAQDALELTADGKILLNMRRAWHDGTRAILFEPHELINGRICASLTPVGFAIKLPKASRDILRKRRGVKSLRYFANGPLKKEYVVLPKALVGDRIAFEASSKRASRTCSVSRRPTNNRRRTNRSPNEQAVSKSCAAV
jgi:hypothetical protein